MRGLNGLIRVHLSLCSSALRPCPLFPVSCLYTCIRHHIRSVKPALFYLCSRRNPGVCQTALVISRFHLLYKFFLTGFWGNSANTNRIYYLTDFGLYIFCIIIQKCRRYDPRHDVRRAVSTHPPPNSIRQLQFEPRAAVGYQRTDPVVLGIKRRRHSSAIRPIQ